MKNRSRYCREWFGAAIAFASLFVCVAPPALAGGSVDAIRYSMRDGRARVVLDLDRSREYTVVGHKDPDRIAINVPGTRAVTKVRNLAVGKGGLERIRVNRLSWGTQVVLDLSGPSSWKHFALASNGGRPDRVVIDLIEVDSGSSVARRRAPAGKSSRRYVVAIDPGHGGKDPGTKGRYGLVEKGLTLDIGRRIAAAINQYEGYEAVLTRTRDVYLTLPRRLEIAEEKGADLFVSIHLNSAPRRSARGAEIFFLSPSGAKREASKMLSDPRRAAGELGLEGGNSDLLHMLVDVNQQSVLVRSEKLAESILTAMSKPSLPPTRAVKQKSFIVLRNITVPSVLVEAGFISNTTDAKLIRESKGRDRIAFAIARGIHAFLETSPPRRDETRSVVVHRVRKGDTLWKLSRQYGASVSSIRKLNQLGSSSLLRPGQELLISDGFR